MAYELIENKFKYINVYEYRLIPVSILKARSWNASQPKQHKLNQTFVENLKLVGVNSTLLGFQSGLMHRTLCSVFTNACSRYPVNMNE